MSTYTILETQPTVYQDHVKGVINGVLVRFTIDDYNEVHDVRVPKMDTAMVKAAIDEVVSQRDALAALGKPAKK
jgi:hypothetical protein